MFSSEFKIGSGNFNIPETEIFHSLINLIGKKKKIPKGRSIVRTSTPATFFFLIQKGVCQGKSIAYLIGRLVFDKVKYQHRWITAMQQTKIAMCFINGPSDPNSGKHMAARYKQLIPNADVRFLTEDIGHWPQIEAPEQVMNEFNDFLGKH